MTAMPSVEEMFADQFDGLRRPPKVDVPRHPRWGGPMIVPPGGSKPEYYQRASTFAKLLDDGKGLLNYYGRQSVIGLMRRPDLQTLVRMLDPDDKDKLNEVVAAAMESAASSAKANVGTALHAGTDHVDLGGAVNELPEELREPIRLYQKATSSAGIEVVGMETFVVLDDLRIAGSFDRLVMHEGRLRIADLKTGQWENTYGMGAVSMQTAIYAHGAAHNPATGQRIPLADSGVDQSTALMIHLPQGGSTCKVYELDIAAGWDAVGLAVSVKAWRGRKNLGREVASS